MTTFRDFCDSVLSAIPRATGGERDAIRAEHDADVKKALEREQRKRHEKQKDGGEQIAMEEVQS